MDTEMTSTENTDIEELIQAKMRKIQMKEKRDNHKNLEKEIEKEAHLRLDTVKLNKAIENSDINILRLLGGNCIYAIPCWVDDEDCYKCISSGSLIESIKKNARQEYIRIKYW